MTSDILRTTNYPDGGEAVLEAFRNIGIDYIISSPGSEWPSLWEALARQKRNETDGPIYLDCGHEILAVTMAAAYTQITGRIQVVVLHAGAGLLQGAMAINACRAMEIPMLIMSGEALGFGETSFDPGSQWYRNLSVVGGNQRLAEPITKWAQQVPNSATLYQSVVRAAELAQRQPKGPTYLCVSMETLLEDWKNPPHRTAVAASPKVQPLEADIESVAKLIVEAKSPIIYVENLGAHNEAFEALQELAIGAGIPVVEGQGAFFGNFPKSNPLYAGQDVRPFLDEIDLCLLVECRAPWYPPSNTPKGATVVSVAENSLKNHMVYQTMYADRYLEGDVASILKLLSQSVQRAGLQTRAKEQRTRLWADRHRSNLEVLAAAEAEAEQSEIISVPALAKAMRECLPQESAYVDETIMHSNALRAHLNWRDPQTFFRAPSGLGQGVGYALGVKLALRERFVVFLVGDGTFMYNPIIPALAFAEEHKLPVLVIVLNNSKYSAMQYFHDRFYPSGVSMMDQSYFGVNITGSKYEEAANLVDGYSKRVLVTSELRDALLEAKRYVLGGKCAVLNIEMPELGSAQTLR
ncbi:thiamine pyrophosphate-binding protein [Pseudorhodoplanes sinuspersici]|nr:thiamine pyrophosphate-binding protein [Pseudorhodoplanes sinuspersici]RKE68216.1 acetolactate synthase-1/2/3 large subunit [Pseudorhodoplanes sinuspersici]